MTLILRFVCISCPRRVEQHLARLGSLRCQCCRDEQRKAA